MNKEELIQRLMGTFLEELEEYVRAFGRDLLAFEKTTEAADRQALVTTLFRTAHSLKGASRAVDLKPLEMVAHQLEEILATARLEPRRLDHDLLQLLFSSVDVLEGAAKRLREKKSLDGAVVLSLLPRLEAAARGELQAPSTAKTPARRKKGAASEKSVPQHLQAVPSEQRQSLAAELKPAPSLPAPLITVRVEKIDALLDRGGEMLIARRRTSRHPEALATLQSEVRRWSSEWRRAEQTLRKLLSDGTHSHGRRRQRAMAVVEENSARLKRLDRELDRITSMILGDQHRLEQAAEPVERELRALRMIPFARATDGLDRAVRDLAREAGKEVDLVVEGGEVEIDRSVAEALRAPLMQLVRNAVSHGIEPPEQRAGKPPRGRIIVRAALRGSRVEIFVADDGRGLDLAAIREQARAMDLEVPSSDQEAAQLIFLGGLSTAASVTGVAGRGVGLDIVKSKVQALHGTIDVSSKPGEGTKFTISVPLTLTTIRAVLVEVAGETFALETAGVARLARLGRDQIRSVEGREVVAVDDALLPLLNLGSVLGSADGLSAQNQGPISVAVVQDGRNAVAFVVDELLSEQEMVVKNLGRRLVRVRNVSGTTLLPDGRLALILNAAELIESVHGAKTPLYKIARQPLSTAAGSKRRRLLIVEDSVATRALQKIILESAGYEVLMASDGAEAWRLLQRELPDLVISDIEMPGMDGFALTEAIRASARLRDLPVILLTALEKDVDKARGIEAGADAYLVKSAFDQSTLLQTISQLL